VNAELRQQIRFCTARDGVTLAFATMGKGPPIVRAAHFLTHIEHDLASPVWRPWLRELSSDNTLVRYDGRGCGLSDREVGDLSLDAMVADLETVVASASLERFALFGCSQGAAITIAYAARHPERVTHLVIWGGYARGVMKRDPTPEQIKEAQMLVELVELGWGRENPAFRQTFTSLFIPDGTTEEVNWFNELERLSAPPSMAARIIRSFGPLDVTADAAHVACPTLVLHARGDARVPFEEGWLVASLIPGARFVPIEGRNHALLEHDPAFSRLFSELHDFLGGTNGTVFPDLTHREREILELVAHGLDNLQVAARLGLSEKTIRNNITQIFVKLAVDTRARAIVRAREAGLARSPLVH
jgi:pimeloyl-ACP methyl ester carboxylesterase/DNA-binding CsgD family transcriptional regulator